MTRFFIHRPVFAWVISIMIMLAGAICITRLPISQYPTIAPPTVSIMASYPGASAKTVEDSVTQIIEQSMTGLDGLIYISSSSDNTGNVMITLTFATGTNPDTAQVQVQNKLQHATPLLPQIVQLQGITVGKYNFSPLMVLGFMSEDGSMSVGDIEDFISSRVVDSMNRVEGVGAVQQFGSKFAMRIWLDPNKLNVYSLTPDDIITAVQGQNAQLSIGQFGEIPAVPGQQVNATITALGRLQTPEQFRRIVIRGNVDGSVLRLEDVARVDLGQSNYGQVSKFNGKTATGLAVSLASGANALRTVDNVRALLKQIEPDLPRGLKAIIPYDSSPFVRKSIHDVVKTLAEAVTLVFLVMLLFLQNIRATLIPTIAVPVVVLGTFAILYVAGYSINMLTMFAIVLAIGLLVDDAIVVVENVERLMAEEGLSPLEATHRSMQQITGALIGIATVLSAVFVPMAFLADSTGVIYRQFSVTIVAAMVLSVIVATIVTPALCASMLKPVKKGEHHFNRGFFSWFNTLFDRLNRRYQRTVSGMLVRPVRYMLAYIGLAALMGLLLIRLPTAFLPNEDQASLFLMVKAPVGATIPRTVRALDTVANYFLTVEKDTVESVFTSAGFTFGGGGGQNSGFGFVALRDWSERPLPQQSDISVQARAYGPLAKIKDALAFAFAPPPIDQLGMSAGFDFFLKDVKGAGHTALVAARNKFLKLAASDRMLANVRPNGAEDAPEFHLAIDPQRVASLGLTMADVNDSLGVAWGGRYIDDFIDRGRVKRVIVQSDAPYRMLPDDFNRWHVRNSQGGMVSASSFSSARWEFGPPQLERFNGASAVEINGEAAPGVSSGQAMTEVEKLVAQLPGFSADWSGQSYAERSAGKQTSLLYALSMFVIFLCLAALYESWSIPVAILLSVPLGVVGAVLATAMRGLERDVYFQVAMLTTIGLACKNAILIVEFAKEYVESGMAAIPATLRAARDRLRPLLMTSFAFGFGVLPLAVATGAGAGAQRAIGTGVVGGTLVGTFLGIYFIPLFFVVVQRMFHGAHEKVPFGGSRSTLEIDPTNPA